jgi:dTDP-4-dehydrorhamnose reductase
MFLVVGGDSEIGGATSAQMRRRRHVVTTTRRSDGAGGERIALDLAGDLAGWDPPAGITATCICAAVARLADCAADPAGSARVNVTGTLALAGRLVARGSYVLFLSTNQVFDGTTPQVAADTPTSPVSEYGHQKARTEMALRAMMARGAPVGILRLAKVVSPRTALLRDWKAALTAGRPIRAFHDMTMAPAPMDALTRAIEALLEERVSGVFQLTGPRDVSYVDVGRFLAARLGADASLVVRTSVSEAGLPAGVGPPHTTLDSSTLRTRYGIQVPDVWDVLDAVLVEMRGSSC